MTLPVVIGELAATYGTAPAPLSEEQNFSFCDLAARAGHYARWALRQRVAPGGVVCLMMANCPEYIAVWLGSTRVGGGVALINTNLVGDALRHAIAIVHPAHVIAGEEFIDAVAGMLPRLDGMVQPWAYGAEGHGWPRIDRELPAITAMPPFVAPTLRARALYIYTSGTTGLPKAASVSHFRLMQLSRWFAGLIGTTSEDRHVQLPTAYHSVGGIVATGAVLVAGGSVALRERFSASRFLDDVVRWDCTLFQYIGELCRYVVSAPPPARTRAPAATRLRQRPAGDIWKVF